MQRIFLIAVAILTIAGMLSLSACGKMTKAEPIAGSGYPHSYPLH